MIFGLFPILGYYRDNAINICLQWTYAFIYLGWMPGSKIAGVYDRFVFNILRNWENIFQSGCTILHFYQQFMRVLVSLYPCQRLTWSIFLILDNLIDV